MQHVPGEVHFGPPTTMREMRNAKPTDPPKVYTDKLYNPTPKEIHEHCMEILEKHERAGGGKA